jgi:hypothetical protein
MIAFLAGICCTWVAPSSYGFGEHRVERHKPSALRRERMRRPQYRPARLTVGGSLAAFALIQAGWLRGGNGIQAWAIPTAFLSRFMSLPESTPGVRGEIHFGAGQRLKFRGKVRMDGAPHRGIENACDPPPCTEPNGLANASTGSPKKDHPPFVDFNQAHSQGRTEMRQRQRPFEQLIEDTFPTHAAAGAAKKARQRIEAPRWIGDHAGTIRPEMFSALIQIEQIVHFNRPMGRGLCRSGLYIGREADQRFCTRWTSSSRPRRLLVRATHQLVEQRLGVLQDRRVEAFGEPAVDGRRSRVSVRLP